ncbi:hypothetical protein [Jiella mangrovi]|uniref:DUF3592 domain-containing protein n=1 Tax=Jiella mangrovi TaxID=2821407 RepID=A0ABS4BBW2_9HYPH|nr:hypothetical protein [Jiella mangrovi]MBP0614238.1 hypothetical protein [Jiella mangrovi]
MRKRKIPRGGVLDAVDSVPITRSRAAPGFLPSAFALVTMPLVLAAVVHQTGLPALRFQYTYTGTREARHDLSCDYLTVTGIRRVSPPPYGINQCGVIAWFPVEWDRLPIPFMSSGD